MEAKILSREVRVIKGRRDIKDFMESYEATLKTKKELFSYFEKDHSLRNLVIDNAHLCNMSWTGTRFENVVFKNCNLTNSGFQDAILVNVEFHSCKMRNVTLSKNNWIDTEDATLTIK